MALTSQAICTGCGHRFSERGLASHLRQTKNPFCRAVFEAQNNYLPDDSSPSPESPPNFPGDFYGDNYGVDDFPFNDPERLPSKSDVVPDPAFDDNFSIVDKFASGLNEFEEEIEAELEAGIEHRWEPPPEEVQLDEGSLPPLDEEPQEDLYAASADRSTAHDALRHPPHVERFNDKVPNSKAGHCIGKDRDANSTYQEDLFNSETMWAPFTSRIDWEVACWCKLRGPSSTAFSDLLKIAGVRLVYHVYQYLIRSQVRELLGLSYGSMAELNKIIDNHLPSRPKFVRKEVIVGGQAFDVYFRDVLECIRALYGNPEFAKTLVFAPERHYLDSARTKRAYHEMHTGDWWWEKQASRICSL